MDDQDRHDPSAGGQELTDERLQYYENFCHDLKTPLSMMYSCIQMLESQPETGQNAGAGHLLEDLKNHWYRMAKLINDVNDHTKIDQGVLLPKYKNHDLVPLLRELAESAQGLARRKEIRLEFYSLVLALPMALDKGLVERIVLNLLSNAVKFTNQGGLVELILEKENNQVRITVRDNGQGIGEDIRGRLFERGVYTQDEAVNPQGSGLGLSITKELAGLLSGDIQAESAPGQGASFVVTLPLLPPELGEDFTPPVDNLFVDQIIQMELAGS